MAKTLDSEITRLYEKFFGTKPVTDEDNQRVDFLERVITGKTGARAKRKTLKDALDEAKDANKEFSYRRFLEAAYATRQWYEDPRTTGKLGAQAVVKCINAMGDDCAPVAEQVELSLALLKEYRLNELLKDLNTTVKSYARQTKNPERTAVVDKVDGIIGRIRAFHAPDVLDRASDLVAAYIRNGRYPVSKQPDTYAERRARDAALPGLPLAAPQSH